MLQNIREFYKGKKVFLTGHTGFKGSWLALWLKELGADITGFSLAPNADRPSFFQLVNLDREIDSVIKDIRDQYEVERAVKESRAEIVFHLAAQPLVRQSYIDPIETYSTNVIGTVNLFEAARKSGTVRSIVNITTDKCYDNKEWFWPYRENDALGGFDPYSSSKACVEIVSSTYRNSFLRQEGIALATARAGNVIGGGDFAKDRIIPDIMTSIINKQDVTLRYPEAIRPWQHVLDVIYGYLILGYKLSGQDNQDYQEAFNFSPSHSERMNVEEITKYFINEIGCGGYKIERSQNLHEAKTLQLDSSKAQQRLKWKAQLGVKETLDYTAEWFKSFLQSSMPIKKLSLYQLNKYINIIEGIQDV